ncbi:prolipoprotein diacylglyceryl transferase [Brachybacterium squillarum]|uniref:prolipoprotein diacylglyceryl transferase n=1 Tax=Brachybacterium squillarum TaxID=661979 RepID=UPI0002629FEB|nr:prolipoprotein diacylglyceryl transferase [Brachybacterium squillarum]
MIPSSPLSAISLGPLTIHFYALCILAGIGVALWWATKRWEARGGDGDDLFDISFAAIIAGIIGARVWHVLTSPEPFFGEGGNPIAVLYIWQGGLAIYGAVAGGALAAWVMARAKGVSFATLADTVAPTLMVAQILGRFGNWFNQELYGPPLDAWWAWDVTCVTNGTTIAGCDPGTYHPTFLYEQLWNLVGVIVLLALARRFDLGGGRVFWAYVGVYSTGRAFIDAIRSEPVLMVGPLRIHTLVAIVMALVAVAMIAILTARYRRRGWEAKAADGSGEIPDPAPSQDQDATHVASASRTTEAVAREDPGSRAPRPRDPGR